MDISKIKKPTILLNEEKARKNIGYMTRKASDAGVEFRPHFKTHQSAQVGEWFREAGVKKITVSSVTMCNYFMKKGWDDITIAFPANPAEIDDINRISESIKLNLLVSDYEQLASFAWNFKGEAGIYIKIDTGYRRSGVDWNQYGDLVRITDLVNEISGLRMAGFLTHSGHTYNARSRNEVISIFDDTKSKLMHTREISPVADMKISLGDTPSCSITTDFKGIDEIRPGNFVFYDLMQTQIGSCLHEDIAVAVACPVVSVNRHHNELVLYGGAVHFSKESLMNEDKTRSFGQVVLLNDDGWNELTVVGNIRALSQEHGIVTITSDAGHKLKPGDIVGILPVHSCLTADLLRSYTTLGGQILSDFCDK
jgi:D-serine deaminase-like pyridoxal phosphate-dependent protein